MCIRDRLHGQFIQDSIMSVNAGGSFSIRTSMKDIVYGIKIGVHMKTVRLIPEKNFRGIKIVADQKR